MTPTLEPGDEFAGHRIEAVAGRGGMGVVYRARQLDLDRVVALKLIAPALAEDPAFRRRFIAESRLAAAIEHPNVVPVHYAGEEGDQLYLAMRFVDGEDLRARLRTDGPLAPDEAAAIVAQVAAGLDAAHARGLVHRDVKPANVLLDGREHAYLTDFGLAKPSEAASAATRAGGWVGSLGYVAPEQIRGDRVDARTDVYALGCVLHHVLTGEPPFVRDSDAATLQAHLHAPPPALTATAPGVPPALERVVTRALAKDPDQRFQSAGDLGRAALVAVGRRPVPVPAGSVATGAAAAGAGDATVVGRDADGPVPGRRWRWLVAAPVAVVAAGGGAIALLGGDDADPRAARAQAVVEAFYVRPTPDQCTALTTEAFRRASYGYGDADPVTTCRRLQTGLARTGDLLAIEVGRVTVSGRRATVRFDRGGTRAEIALVEQAGGWRIDRFVGAATTGPGAPATTTTRTADGPRPFGTRVRFTNVEGLASRARIAVRLGRPRSPGRERRGAREGRAPGVVPYGSPDTPRRYRFANLPVTLTNEGERPFGGGVLVMASDADGTQIGPLDERQASGDRPWLGIQPDWVGNDLRALAPGRSVTRWLTFALPDGFRVASWQLQPSMRIPGQTMSMAPTTVTFDGG